MTREDEPLSFAKRKAFTAEAQRTRRTPGIQKMQVVIDLFMNISVFSAPLR